MLAVAAAEMWVSDTDTDTFTITTTILSDSVVDGQAQQRELSLRSANDLCDTFNMSTTTLGYNMTSNWIRRANTYMEME